MRDYNVERSRVLLLVAFVGAGCGGSGAEAPTYAEDVAPIIERHCAGCHRTGGIAPFPFETYADVHELGSLIVGAVTTRTMPPWNPDNSGSCQTYSNARWLSDQAIDTITEWEASGMLEGPPRGPLAPPPSPTFSPTVTLGMTEPYAPQGTTDHPIDDYRCFVVPGFADKTFVTGYELRPGRPEQVHHVIGYITTTPASDAAMRARDSMAPGPGFPCFGGLSADESGEILGVFGWAPGELVGRYADGVGVEVPAAGSLVLEIHYTLETAAQPDRTEVAFETAASVDWPALLVSYDDGQLRLPPGSRRAEHRHEFSFGEFGITEPLLAYGVAPHMHLRGLSQKLVAVDEGGAETCLMDVPRWDFHWQDTALYTSPIQIDPTDRLQTTCAYDTRGDTSEVVWGEDTSAEMCLSTVIVVRANGRPFAELEP